MLDELIDELLREIFHDSGDENPFYLKFVDIDGVYKLNYSGEFELIEV